jgi:hypothetical protein
LACATFAFHAVSTRDSLRDREPGMLELATLLKLDKSSVTGLVSRSKANASSKRSPPI